MIELGCLVDALVKFTTGRGFKYISSNDIILMYQSNCTVKPDQYVRFIQII